MENLKKSTFLWFFNGSKENFLKFEFREYDRYFVITLEFSKLCDPKINVIIIV